MDQASPGSSQISSLCPQAADGGREEERAPVQELSSQLKTVHFREQGLHPTILLCHPRTEVGMG